MRSPEDRPAPSDAHRHIARRTFLARTAAVGASAVGATALPALGVASTSSTTPAALARESAPQPGRPPRFSPEAWVEPRPEAASDPSELTIAEAAYQLRRGRLTPESLVEVYLERIDSYDETYQAFSLVRAEDALEGARQENPRRGRSPLTGIPLGIKDNYYTADVTTEANSFVFTDFAPPFDATIVAQLKAAGGIVLGKTQMGPLATTRATTPDGQVTTVNAWTPTDPAVDPGGSSTGSATAVAGRMATSSIGTQTGGSITNPSNAQNLTGLKPTMGRASLYGIVPLTYTRDHPGPLARTVMDAAIMLTAMAGPDVHDPRTRGLPEMPDLVRAAAPVVRSGEVEVRWTTRIGVPPGFVSGSDATQRQDFLDTLAGIEGIQIVDVELPDEWELLTETFNSVRLPERTEPFLSFLKQDLTLFGASLLPWLQGLFLSGDETLRGHRSKVVLLERILGGMLEECDVVVQTSPVPFDIVGLPELAVPIGMRKSNGHEIPVGTILGAGPYEEERLLAVGAAYQEVTDHHWRRPADPPVGAADTRREHEVRLTAEDVARQTQ